MAPRRLLLFGITLIIASLTLLSVDLFYRDRILGIVAVAIGGVAAFFILARCVAIRSYGISALLAFVFSIGLGSALLLQDGLITTAAMLFVLVLLALGISWFRFWRLLTRLAPFGIRQWRQWGFSWRWMGIQTIAGRAHRLDDEALVQAPPNRSRIHAVVGWLIGFLVVYAPVFVGVAYIGGG
jgi:hypothetical protein